MIKQLLCLALTFSFLTSAWSATTQIGIKQAIDELNYALEVEWDQKDQKFYREQMEAFTTKIDEIHQQGVDNQTIFNELVKSVKDESVKKELIQVLHLVNTNKMSESQARAVLDNIKQNTKAHGASWSADASVEIFYGAVIVALVASVVYLLIQPKKGKKDLAATTSNSTDGHQTLPSNETTSQVAVSATWQCGLRNTCFGAFGANLDDLGLAFSGGAALSNTCGYNYVCGFFY